MNIWISDYLSVPEIVEKKSITKVISVIEPWENINYNRSSNDIPQIYRISMVDVEHDNHYLSPSLRHIEELIGVALSINENTDRILVHCYAGISRSTAAASVSSSVSSARTTSSNFILCTGLKKCIPTHFFAR